MCLLAVGIYEKVTLAQSTTASAKQVQEEVQM